MQYSSKYLADDKKERKWLSRASYPYIIIWSLTGKLGKSFMEMMERVAWNIIYKQWHCWSEILPAVWRIYLTELPGAWNKSGCKGLGREDWGVAEQGLTGGLGRGHERRHHPEWKPGEQVEE